MFVPPSTDQTVPSIHGFPLTSQFLPLEISGMPQTPISRPGKPWPLASAMPVSTSASFTVRPFLQPRSVLSYLFPSPPVSNHGIPEPVVDGALGAAKGFFALPLSAKKEVVKSNPVSCSSTLTLPAARHSQEPKFQGLHRSSRGER